MKSPANGFNPAGLELRATPKLVMPVNHDERADPGCRRSSGNGHFLSQLQNPIEHTAFVRDPGEISPGSESLT